MTAIKWKSGVSGDWSDAADWTGGVVPGAADDVTIDAPGTFTVTIDSAEAAHSLTLNSANAAVADNNTLALGSTLSLEAGTFQLNSGGTISDGTVSASGGNFQINGGELDGVTYEGTLTLSGAGSSLTISNNGIILRGAGGTGAGTVNLSGSYAQMLFQGSQTLNSATINLSGMDTDLGQTSQAGTLTLGAGLIVNDAGTSGYQAIDVGEATGDSVVNGGVINVTANAANLYIDGLAFTNLGSIDAAGGTTHITAQSWANEGEITATSGATVDFEGNFNNLSGATLVGGTFSISADSTIELANNATVVTDSAVVVLNGAGSNLQSLSTKTGEQVTLDSTLATIATAGTLEILGDRNWSSTLATTNAGLLQLGGGMFTSGALTDTAGSTLSGFGTVASAFSDSGVVTSAGGALAFSGTGDVFAGALTGTEIDFTGGTDALNSGSSLTAATVGLSGGAAVTLGGSHAFSGSWLQGAASVNLHGDMLMLSGTASFGGGATIRGPGTLKLVEDAASVTGTVSVSTNFTEDAASSITVAAGGALSFGGPASLAGALNEAVGSALTIGGGSTLSLTGAVTLGGTLSGGTLAIAGGTTALNSGASFGVAALSLSGGTLAVDETTSFAGTLTDGAASTLSIAAGDTFSSSGSSTFAGTVSGAAGTLAFSGGAATMAAGSILTVANLDVTSAASLTLNTNLSYAGDLTLGTATIALGVNTLTLSGTGSTLAGTVSGTGTGTLAFSGGTQAVDAGAVFSVSNWTVSAGAVTTLNTSLSYSGSFVQGAGTTFGIAAGNTLMLNGVASLAGAITGAGTLALAGAVTATVAGNASIAATLNQGAGTTLALGPNTLTLTGVGSSLAGTVSGTGTLAFSGGWQALNAGAALSVGAWSIGAGAAVSVDENLGYGGTFSEDATSSVVVGSGERFTLSGVATLAGAVGGAGTLAFSGGMETLNPGATITAAAWSIGGGAVVIVNGALTYSGALTEDATSSISIGAGDSLTLDASATLSGTVTEAGTLAIGSGDTLTLLGPSGFSGAAVVDGAGALDVASATISALTAGGTLALTDTGAVTQTGAVTLGDGSGAAASLTVAAGAAWTLDGDVGIALGKSKKSALTILGALIKSAGTGVAKISPKTTDNGLIEAAAGTLDMAGNVAGKGALTIDAGATLELAKTAAKTLTVTFNGAGAALDLGKPAKMAATLAGFTSGQAIDLLKTAATGASVNGSDQLVVVNGTKTVATLQLTGNYGGQTFTVGSDGNGGSIITVSGPGGVPPAQPALFAQTMAAFGGGAGEATAHATPSPEFAALTRLVAPGARLTAQA